jgi:FAD/FMN-containing dehydrogenase
MTAGAVLTRGLGRSYGDSALPPPGVTEVAGSALADRILGFDSATGLLLAEAGLSLAELHRLLLLRGWSVPVSPGTKFVTLGGMVAADVHGKNHHRDGTIGRHVTRLLVRLASGEVVECSRAAEPELFRATLGGMGLTGHVLEVELRMARIPSPWLLAESFPVPDVAAFVGALKASGRDWPFTVGWIDCLHRGGRRSGLGRGVLHRGRWALPEEVAAAGRRPGRAVGRGGGPAAGGRLSVPFVVPGWVLNPWSVRAFNALYYGRFRGATAERPRRAVVGPGPFFYPLDAVRHWNRLYGPRGFTQYQCVLPEEAEGGPAAAAERFLDLLSRSRAASFLCVIKDCGPEGEGVLSFPRPGISIAVDLPVRDGTQELVDALDRQVIAEGGRIYLAKDAFTRRESFQAMEGDRLADFARLRAKYDPEGRLASAQSVRLLGDPRTRWEPRRSARDLPAAS